MAFPGWPEPRFVNANGLKMAVYESGPNNAAPPIVLCHGFPELAFSWRHQLRDLGAEGFRVLAPDQRGYGRTGGPAGPVEAYDIEHLTGDLVGLLDAEGIEKAVFCGHDWGGIITWQMPLRHPDRVAGVIGLNTPFMPRAPVDPIAIFRKRFGEHMYIVFFQTPREPEAVFEQDVEKTFRFFMRKSDVSPQQFDALPEERRNLALQHALARYDPKTDTQQLLTPEELAVFVEAFKATGFSGGINWYRNMTRNWERAEGIKDHIDAPALMIMAEYDVVLPPSAADGMEAFVPNLEKHLVKGSGHWTQQEKPEEVTGVIADWMRKTF